MEASTTTTGLSSIADNTYFVLGAYFFAFFPWAVMHNTDFISEKWRTVRQTRKFAYVHMISSVVPCFYVAVYAEAQRQNKDSKELGAAIAALMFNVIQLLRTLMGKVQVEAFVEWCKHAMECLRALQGVDEERSEETEGESSGYEESDVNDAGVLENKLRLNNTVVDNELGGKEVTVWLSWRRMWNGLKKGELSASKWLKADWAELCTVRWCAAYLCGLGGDWSVHPCEPRKRLELFFSDEMEDARGVLQSVTWNRSEENENSEVISVKWLGNETSYVDLSAETTTAYGSPIDLYNVCTTRTVDHYSFEIDSLVGSYPARGHPVFGCGRERVTARLAHSVILAKHLGVEKLRGIRRCYEQYQVPKLGVLRKALKLYMKQTAWDTSDESEIFSRLCDGDTSSIPLFPYRMQLVALWEQETNWRVLQASAHADVYRCFSGIESGLTPLHELDTKPCNTFDYYSNIARKEYQGKRHPGCIGVVLESVRSFLGEWQMRTTQEVEWEPAVSLECFDFHTPVNIQNGCYSDELHERMIWVCQEALQREVVRISNEDGNLPSNSALIMLFLLGFPDLHMDTVDESEVETYDSNTGFSAISTSSSRAHHSVNVSKRTWKITTSIAPQDIWIEIRMDVDMQKCWVGLKTKNEISRFVWQEWVDAAMGFMAGYNDRAGGKVKYERKIRRADLRDGMVTLCPLRTNDDERVVETRSVEVWMGWPPFDVHICKFEMEQWLKAYDIDLAAHRLLSEDSKNLNKFIHVHREISRAERVIETVVFAQMEEVSDRIEEKRE